jgi:hypothetical protein
VDLPEGKRTGRFNLTPKEISPPGKYRLDVLADGKPWKSTEFTILAAGEIKLQNPEDLFPMVQGTVWVYDHVMAAGEGMKVSLPALHPDQTES